MEIKDLAELYGEELHIKHLRKLIRGSPRAQEIEKRNQLDSADGKVIDEHDQFYRDHKLLLLLFRVMAVMPVQRGQIGKITFSWISLPMIYAYVFYMITTAIVLMVGYERVDILLNKSRKFDEYIYSILFIIFLVPHFWIPFVGWGVAYEVCDYKNGWGTFQLHYYKIAGKNLEFPYLSTLIIILSIGCLLLAVGFLLTLSALLEGFTLYHTTAYYHIITMINMNCALWYINCRAIGNASTALAENFQRDIDNYCTAYIVAHYRVLWLELSELLQKLGNAYARTYSTYLLFMMINITIGIYGFTSEIIDHGVTFSFKEMGLLVDSVYCTVLLYVFCDCSHQASANIAERVQLSLMNVALNSVDVSTTREIELFLKAIHLNPPKVSLQGYSVVNRELVSSKLDYKISVPEFICEQPHSEVKNGKTIIGLEGEGQFYFKIKYKRIGNPCRNNQRCNLIVWKVIRDFEHYLNNYSYTGTKSIEFNNSMLIPGLKYIFNIYITKGETEEEKQFSLDYVDDSYPDFVKTPLASISLIGSPSLDAHMPYVLNAKVNICTNISDYYIEWQLLDHTRSVLETLADRGLELTIPSFTLRSGRQYCIKSNLINMENGKIITDNTKSITVRNNINNLIVKLPMISTTLNVQQPINIKPYIVDLDNNEEEMKTEWFCMYNHQNVCEGLKEDTLSVEGGFLKEGNYNVSIKVSKGSLTKSAFSIIKVKKDVPSIEIVTVQSPVAPSSGIYIKANIDDLRTFCILQWNSEGGPNFFDLESVPGNVNEAFEVFVKRDLFLRELEEFSNDVTNKEHDLIIPPPTGQWMGLPNIDRDYKLRFTLDAKCPKTQLQDSIEVEYSEDMFNDTLTVSAVVEIDVKSAPVLQTLYVERTEGIALETVFTFQTTEALETGTPKPFLYRFGYMLRDRRYIFCNVLDYFTCETILPYNDEGVETFLEVCDSFNSCGKIIGPTINTTLPNEINETDIWRIFKQKINTEDYHRAFGYALTVLYTSKALNGENKYNQHFSEEVVRKIDYLLKSPNKEKNWAKRANKIIRCIIEFNNELSFSEEVLNVLEQLRTELLKSQMKTTLFQQRKLLGMDTPTSEHLVNVDNFESYLQVSDLIISTSKNKDRVEMEKNNIVEKIREFVGKLCMQLYQSRKNVFLAFNSAILVIDELQKKSYGNFHVIPSNKNPWNVTAEIKFNINELEKMKYTRLCIAKIAYRNFFNTKGITYEAILLSADDGSAVMEKVKTTILLPLTEQSTGKLGKCLVYKNGWQTKCQTIRESKGYMLCTCLVMGRFYLDYDDLLTRSETNTIWSKSAENSTQHDEFTLHTYKVSTSISTPAHPIITTAVSVNDDAFSRPDLINSTKIDTPDKNYNFNSEESTSGSITQVTKDISDLDSTNKNYAITTNLDAENNLPTVEEDNISSMKSWSFLLKSGSNYSKFTEATTEMFNPAFLTNEYKTDDEDYSRKSSHETTAVFATTKNAMHDDVSVSTKSVNLIEDVNYSVSITEENDLWKQVHSTNKPTNYSQTGITSPSNIITPVTKNKNNGLQANLNLSINLSLNVTFV